MNNLTNVSPAWFESWFDTPHYHRLYAHHDQREATAFVDRLVEWLRPSPDARMLDLGSGAGRHSRSLAAHGYDVTGLDLAGETIRRARKHETPRLRFVHQDMRESFGHERYDFVFSFFTSFGYFADDAEDDRVVRNIADALGPDGTLVLDYLNVRWSEQRLVASERRVVDGHAYAISRWSDEAHFVKRIEAEAPGPEGRQVHMERVAKFRLADFERLLGRRGLTIETVFGDYDLGPYDADASPRLIVVARKRAEAVTQAA
jgi:SAM-dependent methyltransferase